MTEFDTFFPITDDGGNIIGFSLPTGEPVITDFRHVNKKMSVSKDKPTLDGSDKSKIAVSSLADLQKIIVRLTLDLRCAINKNSISIQPENDNYIVSKIDNYDKSENENYIKTPDKGLVRINNISFSNPISFYFDMGTIDSNFIYELMFNILHDKYENESPVLTLNQYCVKMADRFMETPNTLNKLMAAQIELEIGKFGINGDITNGIYTNKEMICDAKEFGINSEKYNSEYRSLNANYKNKRNKKVTEFKPRRQCEWDNIFFNGKSGLITSKQFRRNLEHDSNYSYSNFIDDFNAYDEFIERLFIADEKDNEKYFLNVMDFYNLEIYKRLDFIYKLAVIMEEWGVSEINKNHFLVHRFYPNILLPRIDDNKLVASTIRKYYKPLLFVKPSLIKILLEYNKSFNDPVFNPLTYMYILRSMVYELFYYNFDFQSNDYNDIANFIRQHYNPLLYHIPKKKWYITETGKINIIRVSNAQKINNALFGLSKKRLRIKKR